MRLFVSSPSDVAVERARVDAVAARLNGEFEGLASIEVVRWETGFYTADRPFQQAIDEAIDRMQATDMVVCILWKRVGSELDPTRWCKPDGKPYESGTVLEFETALGVSREHGGVPDVYLFRKRAPILYDAANFAVEHAQHLLLESVMRRWTETETGHNVAGYQNFADPDDFERQLELCLRQWLERHDIVLRTVWDQRLRGSPFRGLEPFDAGHAAVFFGREAALERAIARLREAEAAGTPFLLLVGASGSGKSSLLRAGLVPRITRPGTIPGIDLWHSALVVPAGDPLTRLTEALFDEGALGEQLRAGDFATPALLAEAFVHGGPVAIAPLRAALDRAALQRAQALGYEAPRPVRLLVAVDQVERIFVEAAPAQADAFAVILHALVVQGLATLVVALRSDAYARFQQVPAFVALMERQGGALYNLLPPTDAELEDIVRKPVAACYPPLVFETGVTGRSLSDALVADARGGDALPLLQMTLQRLFQAELTRGDGTLRFADYAGLDAAVEETANAALATVEAAARAELPAMLTALVRNVEMDPAGGVIALGTSVDRVAFERGLASRAALIDAFIGHRLLTVEAAAGRVRIRAVHDALLRTLPEAVRIIGESAALIRVRHTLEPIAADWAAATVAAKPSHLATSAALLAGAERLLARFGDDLPPAMAEFIVASLAADYAYRTAYRRRHRRALFWTAFGLVVALSLAGVAVSEQKAAEVERGRAERNRAAAEAERGRAERSLAVAEAERSRAERSLAAATRTANGLIADLSQKFRNFGVPAGTIRSILDRILELQDQLLTSGESSMELRGSQAEALLEATSTLMTLGDTKGALHTGERAKHIWESLTESNGDKPEWQRGLARSEFRGSLAIWNRLVLNDANNPQWQNDLSTTKIRVGEVLAAQGLPDAALSAYREGLTLAAALDTRDPSNREWQHNLGIIYERIGDALFSKDQLDGALDAYQHSLAIASKLAKTDAGNTEWQRNLGYSHERIGNVLMAQGHPEAAVDPYRESLTIRKALAGKDAGNTEWQWDLSWAYEKTGDVLEAQRSLDAAINDYRESRAIRKDLVTKDPNNIEWRSALTAVDARIQSVSQGLARPERRLPEPLEQAAPPAYKSPLMGAPGGRVGGASR